MVDLINNVSQPPLNAPMVDANGMPNKAWSIFFRDVFRRVGYKGGNSIDELAGVVDGEIDTLEEVIVVVLDHEERIDSLEGDNEQNKEDIATNSQGLIDLEFRAFGDATPSPYNSESGYVANEYIVNPSGGERNYYRAIENIPAPAGVFDPLLWQKVSLIDNDAYIELTREQAKNSFVAAGYGGIGVEAVTPIGLIDSTWKTLTGFDTDTIATPKDVTYDKGSNGIRLGSQGVWEFSLKVAIRFDDLNTGREIELRAFNATKGLPGAFTFDYFVGRDQGGVNAIATLAVEVDNVNFEVGDLFTIQIGSVLDTFTNSSNIGTILQVKRISELQEGLGG